MKRDLGHRTQALRELADSIDIIRPSGAMTLFEMQNERKNRELCWRSRLPAKPASSFEETVGLVIPPCDNASNLLSLMAQLEDSLHENDSYGSVMHTAYSNSGGTAIIILIQATKFSSLVIKLANMSEVERVENASDIRGSFSSFPNNFEVPLEPNTRPTKSVRVILNETDIADPDSTISLN